MGSGSLSQGLTAEAWHGSLGGYTNHRCRCNACRGAHAEYQREWRISRQKLMERGLANPQHGSDSTYHNWLCRCVLCTEAHAKNPPEREAAYRYRVKLLIYRRASMSSDELYAPRPNWTPQYLEPNCETCTTKLLPIDSLSSGWIEEVDGRPVVLTDIAEEMWAWDEWMCPQCQDRIRFDWPKEVMEKVLADSRKSLSDDLVDLLLEQESSFAATSTTELLAVGESPREILRETTNRHITPDFIVRTGKELIVAPVDVFSAYFRMQQLCPNCGTLLSETSDDLFLIRRECESCAFTDLWRVGVPRKAT